MAAGRIPTTANSPLTTKGDLFTFSTGSAKLAVGTNNQTLIADSAEATGLKYAAGSKATLTTTGDILYASAANTPARLGIGSSAQVLTVASGIPSWATPAAAASGYTFISRSTFSAVATADIDGIFTSAYETYQVVIETCFSSTDSELKMQLRYAGPSTQTTDYYGVIRRFSGTPASDGGTSISAGTHFLINDKIRTGTSQASNSTFTINQVGNGSRNPILYGIGNSSSFIMPTICNGYMLTAREYTGIRLAAVSGNLTAQVSVYGLAKA